VAVQVTEGDGYCLGRVLINAQIAAQVYALTLRLRHLWYWYFWVRLSKKTLLTGELCKPR